MLVLLTGIFLSSHCDVFRSLCVCLLQTADFVLSSLAWCWYSFGAELNHCPLSTFTELRGSASAIAMAHRPALVRPASAMQGAGDCCLQLCQSLGQCKKAHRYLNFFFFLNDFFLRNCIHQGQTII